MTDLKFNIGKSRSEFIGSLTNAVTNQYVITRLEANPKSVIQYLTFQEALYLELQTWIKESDELEEKDQDEERENLKDQIEDALENAKDIVEDESWQPSNTDLDLYHEDKFEDIIGELKKSQRGLAKLRKEIGLDIPESKDVDPEDAAIQGLRDN